MQAILRLVANVLSRAADGFGTMADNLDQEGEPHLTVVESDPGAPAAPVFAAERPQLTPEEREAQELLEAERSRQAAQSVSEAVAQSDKAL